MAGVLAPVLRKLQAVRERMVAPPSLPREWAEETQCRAFCKKVARNFFLEYDTMSLEAQQQMLESCRKRTIEDREDGEKLM